MRMHGVIDDRTLANLAKQKNLNSPRDGRGGGRVGDEGGRDNDAKDQQASEGPTA